MKRVFGALTLLSLSQFALAEEGMWLPNAFPSKQVEKRYGFAPDLKWLQQVQLASVRLAGGCSGSFVSKNGLVMTNHHCAHECIVELSSADNDYIKNGFYAKTEAEERRCPDLEVDQLQQIEDVTDRIRKATANLSGDKFSAGLQETMSKIEKECASGNEIRCDVVTLYYGGQYHLYRYRRFQDVRLVFAPEFSIAFFGGDPDNFMYPRYDLDVSFLRVYQDGKPLQLDTFFRWSKSGAADGELTFISGQPGKTARLQTVAQLEFLRDTFLPALIRYQAEFRGMLAEFQKRGPEQKRISQATLFACENSLKAQWGRHQALLDKDFYAKKISQENAFRKKIASDPRLRKIAGGALEAIEQAIVKLKPLALRLNYLVYARMQQLERGLGFHSDLFRQAMVLVGAAEELSKPNELRLREYTDANLPALKNELFSPAPIYDEFEIALLGFSLSRLREALGADDPFVKKVLGNQSPDELAAALVSGSKLKDSVVRQQLFQGGKAALETSSDPMILLARSLYPDIQTMRALYENQIAGAIQKNTERVAQAYFALHGTQTYPDATFTLRITYGQVKGYQENSRKIEPFTTLAGAFARHTGRDPFALPNSWVAAKDRLNPNTPLNFCSTNDIIGGNSGSPVINRNAEIVGLVFDGNIQSLAGDYYFDEAVNRAVSVDSRGLIEVLDKIYKASGLIEELRK